MASVTAKPQRKQTCDRSRSVCYSEVGYDLAADGYDGWHWQEFWRKNEEPLVLELIERFVSKAQLGLDIGTGTGRYAGVMSTMGFHVAGVDNSRNMLAVAARKTTADLRLANASELPFADRSFDVAIACRVLSHSRDIRDPLREAARVTKYSGVLILTDIDALHAYQHTRIPTRDGDVYIRTYKHSLSELVRIARETSEWDVLSSSAITVTGLRARPSLQDFPRIDPLGIRPVFFAAAFRRRFPRTSVST